MVHLEQTAAGYVAKLLQLSSPTLAKLTEHAKFLAADKIKALHIYDFDNTRM
jgi:hypothetical protein